MSRLQQSAMLSLLLLLVPFSHGFSTPTSVTFVPRHSTVVSHDINQPHPIPHFGLSTRRPDLVRLTTTSHQAAAASESPQPLPSSIFTRALIKFRARPATYLIIPCVAAIVGWFTNWLAVQMIFYPIEFRGIPLYRRPEIPLGCLGWQGIIPCKTRPMTNVMVDMVTTQLLTVQEAFGRLDPRRVAALLGPEVPKLTREVLTDLLPARTRAWHRGVTGLAAKATRLGRTRFLTDLTQGLQQNADSVFSLRQCVLEQMMLDRGKLGELFRKCGEAELSFLTNSGLWFGFLLGLIQMVVALFWDNPWSLSIGGGIVGLATNWLALKWIFEPVNPTKVGPFVLQGKFLRRQKEVAAEFSNYFANNVLTGEQIWHSILTDPQTKPAFAKVFAQHFESFLGRTTLGLKSILRPKTLQRITEGAIDKLPNHVPVLFPYMDQALGLETTLRIKMEQMTSAKFERVLHPIFEQDELTLILAGAALGFAAGLVQQGIETEKIKLPDFWTPCKRYIVKIYARIRGTAAAPDEDQDN